MPFYWNDITAAEEDLKRERERDRERKTYPVSEPGFIKTMELRSSDKDPAPTKMQRFNAGKLPLHLVDTILAEKVAEILRFGIQKGYEPDNWRKGGSWRETIGSLERHVADFKKGIDLDHESKLENLAHAACNIMFLLYFFEHGLGTDDRIKH
jgi:hypothetical protein